MKNQNRAIKRLPRNPEKFDVIDLFDAIGRGKEYVLGNIKDEASFISVVRSALSTYKTSTMIYGRRVEAMFAYVAASLGKCKLVKKEDCGDVFFGDDHIEIPDYRVVLNHDGSEQMLVEVKNYNQKNAFDEYSMKVDYLNGLSSYAAIVRADLRIAIYWSRWGIWTLVSPDDFESKGKKATIQLNMAMQRNQMSTIGDVMIGTTPPLIIRIYPDKQPKHNMSKSNMIEFTIGKVEMLCKNTPILEESEQRIAFALMLFNGWPEKSMIKTFGGDESEIEYIEFSYEPNEYDERQGFCVANTLSTIISRQYGQLTAPDGKVQHLSIDIAPGMLGFIIPEDYVGKALPLWRFHMEPNYK